MYWLTIEIPAEYATVSRLYIVSGYSYIGEPAERRYYAKKLDCKVGLQIKVQEFRDAYDFKYWFIIFQL